MFFFYFGVLLIVTITQHLKNTIFIDLILSFLNKCVIVFLGIYRTEKGKIIICQCIKKLYPHARWAKINRYASSLVHKLLKQTFNFAVAENIVLVNLVYEITLSNLFFFFFRNKLTSHDDLNKLENNNKEDYKPHEHRILQHPNS